MSHHTDFALSTNSNMRNQIHAAVALKPTESQHVAGQFWITVYVPLGLIFFFFFKSSLNQWRKALENSRWNKAGLSRNAQHETESKPCFRFISKSTGDEKTCILPWKVWTQCFWNSRHKKNKTTVLKYKNRKHPIFPWTAGDFFRFQPDS